MKGLKGTLVHRDRITKRFGERPNDSSRRSDSSQRWLSKKFRQVNLVQPRSVASWLACLPQVMVTFGSEINKKKMEDRTGVGDFCRHLLFTSLMWLFYCLIACCEGADGLSKAFQSFALIIVYCSAAQSVVFMCYSNVAVLLSFTTQTTESHHER
jgi:hypothetical protein